jgi:hypothetical protein
VGLRANGGWALLRPGPITPEAIAQVLGEGPEQGSAQGIEAPGQLASHYAPGKPVRLNATDAKADEFLIGLGAIAGDVNLSPGGDLAEAAARLYACLHAGADAPQPASPWPPCPTRDRRGHQRPLAPGGGLDGLHNSLHAEIANDSLDDVCPISRHSRAGGNPDPVPCLHAQPPQLASH